MKIIDEFKEFISRGNVIDLAVGIITGTAFNDIVNSLVKDVIMPIIGVLLKGVDFTSLKVTLLGDAVLSYGNFIQKIVNFLIISGTVFFMIKAINRFRLNEEAKNEKKVKKFSEEAKLLREIRDLLKTQGSRNK